MHPPRSLGNLTLWVGALCLAATVTLHLMLGLPPIEAAIEDGFIRKGPGISPGELSGVWIAFSGIFYVLLAGMALDRLTNPKPSALFPSSIGIAALASALSMFISTGGIHISVPLLTVPGVLLVAGAFMTRAENE